MIWVDILVVIILILSFLGGLKGGAVKQFFYMAVLIVAIPLAGLSYRLIAIILSFLPGESWENFIGFFIALGLMSVILQLIILLPRKIIQKVWRKGVFFRLLGGALNAVSAGIGMAVFTLVLLAYPIFDWLGRAVANSGVLVGLVELFSFVQAMLPEAFQDAVALIVAGSLM